MKKPNFKYEVGDLIQSHSSLYKIEAISKIDGTLVVKAVNSLVTETSKYYSIKRSLVEEGYFEKVPKSAMACRKGAMAGN